MSPHATVPPGAARRRPCARVSVEKAAYRNYLQLLPGCYFPCFHANNVTRRMWWCSGGAAFFKTSLRGPVFTHALPFRTAMSVLTMISRGGESERARPLDEQF